MSSNIPGSEQRTSNQGFDLEDWNGRSDGSRLSYCVGLHAEIERLTAALADKEKDCLRLHKQFMDAKYGPEQPDETSAGSPLEWTIDAEGWWVCSSCDQEVVEVLKCTGCGRTGFARASKNGSDERPT